jgi:hypothetical protein
MVVAEIMGAWITLERKELMTKFISYMVLLTLSERRLLLPNVNLFH